MAWTYYKQVYPNAVRMVFCSAAGWPDHVFHRQQGWVAIAALRARRRREINAFDIISEEAAEALLRRLGTSR